MTAPVTDLVPHLRATALSEAARALRVGLRSQAVGAHWRTVWMDNAAADIDRSGFVPYEEPQAAERPGQPRGIP